MFKHCNKCNDPLVTGLNAKHGGGGQINWCDDCWAKFWNEENGKKPVVIKSNLSKRPAIVTVSTNILEGREWIMKEEELV